MTERPAPAPSDLAVRRPGLLPRWIAAFLLARMGASVRGRIDSCGDEVSVECDLRLRYRGANLLLVAMAGVGGALAAWIGLFFLLGGPGPR